MACSKKPRSRDECLRRALAIRIRHCFAQLFESSSVEGSGDLWTHAASRITKTVPRNGGQ